MPAAKRWEVSHRTQNAAGGPRADRRAPLPALVGQEQFLAAGTREGPGLGLDLKPVLKPPDECTAARLSIGDES